jgi:hypothetical protein
VTVLLAELRNASPQNGGEAPVAAGCWLDVPAVYAYPAKMLIQNVAEIA